MSFSVGNLQALKPREARPAHDGLKACAPGCLHTDIKSLLRMADEDRRRSGGFRGRTAATVRRHPSASIDRATRWVFVRICPAQSAAKARRFLRDLARAAPMMIARILTDNGKEFTERLFGLRKRAGAGQHEFALLWVVSRRWWKLEGGVISG